jgi:hypothetical protein
MEAAAAPRRARASRLLYGRPLNFPAPHSDSRTVNGSCGGSSKSEGVTWDEPTSKWEALVEIGGMDTHLGYFDDEREAASTYNTAAERLGRPLLLTGSQTQRASRKRPRKHPAGSAPSLELQSLTGPPSSGEKPARQRQRERAHRQTRGG